MVWKLRMCKTGWLSHKHILSQMPMKKSIMYIYLMHIPKEKAIDKTKRTVVGLMTGL
jgi:hypothetical protein